MAIPQTTTRKFRFRSSIPWLLLLFCCFLSAQLHGQSDTQSSSAQHSDAAQNPETSKPSSDSSEKEQKISPAEAKDLFQSVDQILKFASKDSGLPIKHPVKSKLTSRDEVVSYLEKSMKEDKSAQRVYRSELVLKKFGLLPRDFHLEAAVVAMLREQVAGYYDPKNKTMNLLDWVPVDQQKPVLAHELTHALQDQSFGLDKWMKKGDVDLDKKKNLTPADIQADEADEAREAVVEGQAEAVMVNYILAPIGRTVVNSPETIAALDEDMLNGTPDSTEFKNAPIFLKESLTFPYRYGIKFVVALMKANKANAFSEPFQNVPQSTRQIMEPATYLSGEHVDPLPMPDLNKIFKDKDYERFDVGSIGEFDVSMLLEQYAGLEVSNKMYPAWRGGYYYSARPKGNPAAPLGLLYVSRWSDPAKAGQFAAIYAKSLPKRYKTVQNIPQNKDKDKDQDQDNDKDDAGQPVIDRLDTPETLNGIHAWQTEEGPVVIDVQGATVLVSESLDEKITSELEHDALAGTNPLVSTDAENKSVPSR
jgi:hypothetical protein